MRHVLVVAAALLTLSGCAAIRRQEAASTEQLLAAAGFNMRAANTPERVHDLTVVLRLKIVARSHDSNVRYTFANPYKCRCLYVGGSKEYSAYQHMVTEQRIAQERIWAEEEARTGLRGARGTGDEGPGVRTRLMLAATVAWGQGQPPAATDAFRVSWQRETDLVAGRIEGRVHNDSPLQVSDVRRQVDGLDAGSRPVGRTFAWALGDIAPGGDTSFVTEAVPGAVTYRITNVSYDVVQGRWRANEVDHETADGLPFPMTSTEPGDRDGLEDWT